MKKNIIKKSVSLILTLCVMMSTAVFTLVPTYAANVDDVPMVCAGSGTFEADNSYLTKEEYAQLGFNLKSAQSFDKNTDINPLLGKALQRSNGDTKLTYTGNVEYGWSNPCVLSVMLSTPYWDDIYYGDEMSSAGLTQVSLSSSIALGEESSKTVDVGVSITVSEEITAGGNGVTFGGGVNIGTSEIVANTSEKATTKSTILSCGAQTDNVALYTVPMAIYEYELQTNGKTEKTYVQVPLGTVFSTTTLDNYNEVAHDVNERIAQNGENTVEMLIIDMDEIHKGYKPGEPPTYFADENDFPTSFSVVDNHLVPNDSAPEITGTVHSSDIEYSVSGGSNSSGAISYEGSKSQGESYGQSLTLGANASAGIKCGVDVLGVTAQTTVEVEVEASYESVVSKSTVNTQAFSSSVEYINLPSHTKDSYSFTCSQIVWTPDNVSENVSGCPLCIIGSTVSKNGDYPPFLPSDLYVSQVTNNSVTLSWTNPNFGEFTPDRMPDYYKVCMASSGNISSFNERVVVSGDCTSATVTGLKSGTSYTFALQSTNSKGCSVIGPKVSVTTCFTDQPVITSQPQDVYVEVGESAVLSTQAQLSSNGTKLSYQWQQLETGRYGTEFVDIDGETGSTLTLDVNNYTENELHNTVYRCVVTQKTSDGFESCYTDTATVKVVKKIDSFDELCDVALQVNLGNPDYTNGYFILTEDIDTQGEKFLTPIGTVEHPFSGTFDGMGHTIDGLYIYDSNPQYKCGGLFGVVKNGEIRNLNLTDVNIAVAKAECGVVCGSITNGVISNCSVSGVIYNEAVECTGGIVSYMSSSYISRCMNNCEVNGSVIAGGVGGICGYAKSSIISNCGNTGKVYNAMSDNCTGGICGEAQHDVVIKNCFNTGVVKSESSARYKSYPICVEHDVTVKNCYYSDVCVTVDSKHEYLGEVKTVEQFENGEVTNLLNCGDYCVSVWTQTTGVDKHPVLK